MRVHQRQRSLHVVRGGGKNALFGLPFLIIGLAVPVLIGLGIGETDGDPRLLAVVFPLTFGLVGLILVAGRQGFVFDRQAGTVRCWRGLLLPMHSRMVRLETFGGVRVYKAVHRGQKSSSVTYPVELVGDENLRLGNGGGDLVARRIAETVAKYLELPLTNELTGTAVTRPAAQLDWSLRQQQQATGEVLPEPVPPQSTALRVEITDSRVRIELPQPGLMRSGGVVLVAVIAAAIMPLVIIVPMLGRMPGVFGLLFGCAVLVPVCVILAMAAKRGLVRTQIEIDDSHFRLRQQWPWRSHVVALPADEIEELTCNLGMAGTPLAALIAGGSVHIVSDQQMLRLGTGCSASDLQYLEALIRYALCR